MWMEKIELSHVQYRKVLKARLYGAVIMQVCSRFSDWLQIFFKDDLGAD